MSVLEARGLSFEAGGRRLVAGASFRLAPGTLTMLIGPNGSGKSSLLRLALGLLPPSAGSATIDGAEVRGLSPAARARKVAYLPQTCPLAWPVPVRDVIALGRFAHGVAPGRLAADDARAVACAIAACRLAGLEDRAADTLSGGELARVHLARALAAEAPLLVADEPVAALDPLYQHEVAALFARAARAGHGVLTVMHDLALAARYADRLLWMKDGAIVADGTVEDTMTPARLADVFGVAARIDRSADGLALAVTGPA